MCADGITAKSCDFKEWMFPMIIKGSSETPAIKILALKLAASGIGSD
jgi:hypothetical protein